MATDWLFGPRDVDNGEVRVIRSLVLDHDTVRDLYAIISEHIGGAELIYVHPSGGEAVLDIEDLHDAADWQLRRLILRGKGAHGWGVTVNLRQGTDPYIQMHDRTDPRLHDLERQVTEVLLADGKPRARWKPLAMRLPQVAALLLLACWIWVMAAERPPISVALVGTLIVVLACVMSWDYYARNGKLLAEQWYPGHRIRPMSRQEVRTRRADRNANAKILAMSVPSGALLGGLASWFFTR